MMYGDMFGSGDINTEARKLKNRFAKDELELTIVQHSEWSPVMTARSIGGGMSSVTFNKEASLPKIKDFLKRKGFDLEQIAAALDVCTSKNLFSTDDTAGRFFIGIPI